MTAKPYQTNVKMVYICAPYTHWNPGVVSSRERAATALEYALVGEGVMAHNPIRTGHNATGTDEHWRRHGMEMLERSDAMLVLDLDGWEKSEGVQAELSLASAMRMPVMHLPPSWSRLELASVGQWLADIP